MENTDFVIENIDKEVKVIADNPSSVTNFPANTDFFIENIDANVISIAHSEGIEATEVGFRPANTDFFIENIDSNVIEIANKEGVTPSEVTQFPANTDFFIENIDANLIKIALKLGLTPYEVEVEKPNTDFFIENIDKNVTLIKGKTNVIVETGSFITVNIPDGGTMQLSTLYGNAEQDGTPTPSTPQAIETVTGEQTVGVVGKNLFDGSTRTLGAPSDTAWINSTKRLFNFDEYVVGITRNNYYSGSVATTASVSDGAYTITATQGGYGVGLPIKLLPSTAYTASATITNPENSQLSVAYYQEDGTFLSFENPVNTGSINFTTPSNVGFSVIILGTATNQTCTYSNIQLELGSTATAYEPYQGQSHTIDLGSIELAKIGNYQDRIYKSEGKWYIEKQTGKVVLDGSNDEGWYSATNYFQTALTSLNISNYIDFNNPTTNGLCNHFTPRNRYFIINSSAGIDNSVAMASNFMAIRYLTATDLADFTTWLANNPTTVYYALATPTTTEITDETLLSQLNFIASLYGGVNNISLVGTGAQGSMEVLITKN